MNTTKAAVYALALAGAVIGGAAIGQDFPSRPVRIVVPFGPGGGTDIVARIVGANLSDRLGQPFVVENRPGASGTLALEYTVRAAADGHTLVVGSTSEIGIGASLHKQVRYNVARDLVPVVGLASSPLLLVVNPALEAKTVADLVALAKARPGKLNFGSAGNGSGSHLAGELFRYLARVDIVHVPYKGAGLAQTGVIGGEIQIFFPTVAGALGPLKAGRLTALGVSSSKRHPMLPEVPTLAEQGVVGHDADYWYGIFAPVGTPKAVLDRLHAATTEALRTPDVNAKLEAQALVPMLKSQEEFAAFVQADIARWAALTKAAGIKEE